MAGRSRISEFALPVTARYSRFSKQLDGYLEINITHKFLEARNTPETLVEEIRKVAGVDAAQVEDVAYSIESIPTFISTPVLVDLSKIAIPSIAGLLGTWILANAKKKIILRRGIAPWKFPQAKLKKSNLC